MKLDQDQTNNKRGVLLHVVVAMVSSCECLQQANPLTTPNHQHYGSWGNRDQHSGLAWARALQEPFNCHIHYPGLNVVPCEEKKDPESSNADWIEPLALPIAAHGQ